MLRLFDTPDVVLRRVLLFATIAGIATGAGCQRDNAPFTGFAGAGCAEDDPIAVCAVACRIGDGVSCARAADALMSGVDEPRNPAHAADLYELGCTAGSAESCAGLGAAFFDGEGRPRDDRRASTYLSAACRDAGAGCSALGVLIHDGRGGHVPDPKAAVALWEAACARGDASGCSHAGLALWYGRSVPLSTGRALELLRKGCRETRSNDATDRRACEIVLEAASDPAYQADRATMLRETCDAGLAAACGMLAHLDATNEEALDEACALGDAVSCTTLAQQTPDGGATWLVRGCDGGDARACIELGERYRDGRDVQTDLDKARALFDRACRQASGLGCASLADLSDGPGVLLLLERACGLGEIPACLTAIEADDTPPRLRAALARRACVAGSSRGCYELGLALEHGRGLTRDYTSAFSTYERSCHGGTHEACVRQGVLLDLGQGVERSRQKAVALFEEGCRRGVGAGCTYLGAVAVHTGEPDRGATLLERGCRLGHEVGCKQLERLRPAL